MNIRIFNKISICFILGIAFSIVAYVTSQSNNYTTQELAEIAQTKLHKKETLAYSKLVDLSQYLKTVKPKDLFLKYSSDLNNLYSDEGISIYIYENDSLCFWTDNQPAIDLNAYTNENNVQLIKIRNGWFEYLKLKDSANTKFTSIALIKIKSEYDYENKYLTNDFSPWLELPKNTNIISPVAFLKHCIKSKFGTPLFEIQRRDGLYKNKLFNIYTSIFSLLAFSFFGITWVYLSTSLIKNKLIRTICLLTSFFVLRTAMIYFKFPNFFYLNDIYNAGVFANASSFFFCLLGDVFINSLLLFLASIYIYRQKITIKHLPFNTKLFIFFISFVLLEYFALNITSLIYSILINSSITFNVNQLFDFSYYSLIGLSSVGFMIFGLFLFIEKITIQFIENFNLKKPFIFISVILILLTLLYKNNLIDFEYFWIVPLIIISFYLRRYKASNNFINIGLVTLIITFITSYFFNKYEQINKKITYETLSHTLTDRQDVIAENELSKITTAIQNDVKLKNLISLLPLSSAQIEQKIKQVNFSGYFERYDVVLSLFKNKTPLFNLNDSKYLSTDYFENQMKDGAFQTICDNLFFINKKNNPIRYVGKIEIIDSNLNRDSLYQLYFQLDPKISITLGIFPDLLLDKSLESKVEFKNISYAVYENNKLQMSYGDFQYPLFNNTKYVFKIDKDYNHFIYPKTNNIEIIISDNKTGFWQLFTSNSYLFIFFSIIVLGAVWFNSMMFKNKFEFKSLNNRIQFILVSIIIISLAGVVIGTIWVVTTQSEIKNKKELLLKSKSVLNELQQSIGQQNVLEPSYKEYTTFTLKKLSKLFGSDVSLFDNKGHLFATSQPAIYEQGLVSKFMNPIAFSGFSQNKTVNFSHREAIGKLNYLSTYIPFYNSNDKLLGYLNLPYFSRQKDLEKELSVYLTTLLNIYTILFVITTLVALFISNLLTKPLRIIKQQISNTKLEKNIKPIIWNSNDEIGNLVTEYNSMLVKLKKNSELLAQSERESAWLEMSKQVAHEIKNPLTPMKLNIQHLQRVVKSNPENISEKVDKVAEMLIQQIDTLSNIATEFSNFSKFPSTKIEKVDLVDLLQNATNLFNESSNCIIECEAEKNLFVLVDKEQCIRVLTNLIKNAEQSIPGDRIGRINIQAQKISETIEIKISDNGSGIPLEFYNQIFTPKFTTKNSGTGLGLAMVKNSITAFNGTIEFKSELGVGTTFTILLPALS